MSAVIWCGIVAVWVFVLIPTWVRRGDIHWHRGAAVASRGATATADAAREDRHRSRFSRLRPRRRSRTDSSVEVETMAEQEALMDDETPVTAEVQRAPGGATRARVAAASRSGRLGGAVRASLGQTPKEPRKKPPLRIRRARRLVALAALSLLMLIITIVAGGFALIVVTLLCFLATFLYMRHLRAAARNRRAQIARERRARAARQAWEQASHQERASQLEGWRAAEPATTPYEATDAGFAEDEDTGEYAYQATYEETGRGHRDLRGAVPVRLPVPRRG